MSDDDLRATMSGGIFRPDDEGYRGALQGQNLAASLSPDLVVTAKSAKDVQTAVRYAIEAGMKVSVLSTGHGSELPVVGGMTINVAGLDEITIDPDRCTATIGGGVRAGALAAAAAEHGLVPVGGSGTTVGFTGLVLGGGLGPLARSHGYSSDYVTRFTVVTADSKLTVADSTKNPDLYWALRGGKYGFGVVVETEVQLIDLPTLYGGSIAFDANDIETVLGGWADWTKTAPVDVTTSVAIMRFPPIPAIPESMRGKTLLMLRFAYPGEEAVGRKLAEPLLALGTPAFGGFHQLPASDIGAIHNDPVDPMNIWTEGVMLTDFNDDMKKLVLDEAGPDKSTPFMMVEIRHLGAATHRDAPEGSAAGGREANYALLVVGMPNPAMFAETHPEAWAELRSKLEPYRTSDGFINFVSGRDDIEHDRAWTVQKFERLSGLRARYDATNSFV